MDKNAERSMPIKTYRMMDVVISVSCNDPEFFDVLDMQPWFEKLLSAGGEDVLSADIDFISKPSRMRIRGKEFELLPGKKHFNAYIILMDEVIRQNSDFLMIHGAAVYKDGKAYAFIGPSNSGKSTLLYALAGKGFGVVTDDLILLDLKEQKIKVIRDIVSLRKDSFGFFNMDKKAPACAMPDRQDRKYSFKDETKAFIRAKGETKRESSDVELGKLFVFSKVFDNSGTYVVDLYLRSNDDAFVSGLFKLQGISLLEKNYDNGLPVFRFSVLSSASEEFGKVCKKNENNIFYSEDVNTGINDFSKPPEIKAISKKDAIFAIIDNLLNRRILKESIEKGYPELMLKLGILLERVDCYSLKPGLFDKTVEEVKSMIEKQ